MKGHPGHRAPLQIADRDHDPRERRQVSTARRTVRRARMLNGESSRRSGHELPVRAHPFHTATGMSIARTTTRSFRSLRPERSGTFLMRRRRFAPPCTPTNFKITSASFLGFTVPPWYSTRSGRPDFGRDEKEKSMKEVSTATVSAQAGSRGSPDRNGQSCVLDPSGFTFTEVSRPSAKEPEARGGDWIFHARSGRG